MISLYYDGELPPLWKEKLETHVAACSQCRDRLEQFRRLSGTLEKGASFDDPTDLALQERVWRRLNAPLGSPAVQVRKQGVRVWRRSIPVPLPLAVAAAALILVFGVFFIRGEKPVTPADSALAVLDMQTTVPDSDFNRLLQYLENDDSPDIVIIRLPESRSFLSPGEPKLMRAVDYSGGSGSR
jgi:anti-sigma factor RsiW